MSPPDRNRSIRHVRRLRQRAPQRCSLTATIALILLAAPAMAQAETPITAQALADNGVFLPDAPAPSQRAGLCLIDTGVNLNPDTEGIVIDRTAIDGGPPNDVSPTLHGTVMAMMAGAPTNGWGMIGTAPKSIHIISVRILEPGQTSFPFTSYAAGITACLRVRKQYDIKVINLSLGDPETPSSEDYETVGNAIEEASDYGVQIVAAAGNDDGGPIGYPAAYPGVLSIGAADTQGGSFCPFSNRGEGLRMIAAGCDLDGADPASGVADYNYWQGTSEASDLAASALDALDSYQSNLAPQAAEEDLANANHGVLDIAQAFRDAGLGQIVSEGEAAEPRTATAPTLPPAESPQSVQPSSTMTVITRFQRPRVKLKRLMRRLLLLLDARPREARAQVRYLGHHGRSHRLTLLRTITGTFTSLTLPASGVVEVSVRYADPYDLERSSPWTNLPLPTRPQPHPQ
jgi:hypothetical protein